MKLTVLISTLNEGILGLEKVVAIVHPQVCYLVIHQNLERISIPEFLNRTDIEVITSYTKGLSKSRNLGIKHCKTPYALIADDDVRYFEDSFDTIIKTFENRADLDLAMFKIKTPPGDPEYKKYPENAYVLKEESHIFSSIEIAFRLSSIRQHKIKFDRRFGLGSYIPRGEELFFVLDTISKKLHCMYFPYFIVEHPYESSGKTRPKGLRRKFDNGAVEERLHRFSFGKIKWKFYRESLMNNMVYILGALFIRCTRFLR